MEKTFKKVTWEFGKLGEVCHIIPGYAFKSQDWKKSGIPVVKIKNIKSDCTVDTENVDYVSESLLNCKIKKYLLKDKDIVIAMTGATAGKVGKIRTDKTILLNQRVAKIEPFNANKEYIWEVVSSKEYIRRFFLLADGAAQPNMSGTQIENIEVPLPPKPVQNRISSILSAYDDLIENNNRRIKILEEMAQTIYNEWFVKFRFPGHSKVKMVDSKLGKIPQGWEIKPLSDIVQTQYGYTESASEKEIGPKFVRGKDINKNSYIEWQSVPYCRINNDDYPKYKLHKGDIVVVRMADPGKVGIVEKDIDAIFASYLVRLKSVSTLLSTYYLFYTLISDKYQSYIKGASTGTTRKSASAGVLTGMKIFIPTKALLESFEIQAGSIRELLNNLVDKNAILCKTRDLLLPKLISGEIDVEDMDIDIGDVD